MRLQRQRSIDKYLGGFAIALLRPATMIAGRILRRNHELKAGREVVWIKMLGGGSLLLALPMLRGFRRDHPDTRLVLITTPSVRPFADLVGVFDEYRVIDVGSIPRMLVSSARALVQTMGADCVVDLEVHSRLTTVFTTLTMARNRVSFWLEDIFWRRGLASHLVFFNRSSPSFHFYDRIGELFGSGIADRAECFAVMLSACGMTAAPVRDPSRVAIGFACSDLGQERMLTPEQWAAVFRDNMRPEQRTFDFLGAPGDRALGDAIIARVSAVNPGVKFRNRCGELRLTESVAAIASAGEFWGIDSSLLHIARIAGVPCLSYWGPTDPATRLRALWQIDERTVYRKIACSPCVHTSEEPPCHGNNRCIKSLFDPNDVAPVGWTPFENPST